MINPQKEFKIASILFLFLGVIDAVIISMDWFGSESPLLQDNIFLLILLIVICLIALGKLYMGFMGLKYCKGTGKGSLHITLAKIGVVLAAISVVISVVEMINGEGTLQTVISDVTDAFIVYWYLRLAKKVCT